MAVPPRASGGGTGAIWREGEEDKIASSWAAAVLPRLESDDADGHPGDGLPGVGWTQGSRRVTSIS